MKIKRVDAFAIRIPDGMHPNGDTDADEYAGYSIAKDKWTSIYSKHHETALVRIETDDGILGIGSGGAYAISAARALLENKEMSAYDIAKKHVELTYLIRIEEGWNKIPQKLELAAKKVDIVLNEVEGESSKHLNELKKYWKEKQIEFIKNLPMQMGKIKTILPNGMAGFIKNNDGTDYYFAKRDFSGNPNDIKEGLSVKFNIRESFDKKKKKKSVAAFNIILDN